MLKNYITKQYFTDDYKSYLTLSNSDIFESGKCAFTFDYVAQMASETIYDHINIHFNDINDFPELQQNAIKLATAMLVEHYVTNGTNFRNTDSSEGLAGDTTSISFIGDFNPSQVPQVILNKLGSVGLYQEILGYDDELDFDIPFFTGVTSDEVSNESGVAGKDVTNALDTLDTVKADISYVDNRDAATLNSAKQYTNVEINKIAGQGKFVDGTLTTDVGISTNRPEGPLRFSIKDTTGGTHTFIMNDLGQFVVESEVLAPEINTQKITFAKDKDLEYEDQDGGKLKLNNIPIFDAFDTRIGALKFTSKEDAVDSDDLPNLAQVISLISGGGVDVIFADGVKVKDVKWSDKADKSYVDTELSKKADQSDLDSKLDITTAEATYAKVEGYDIETGGKGKFTHQANGETIWTDSQLGQPKIILEDSGINMLNGQIQKVVPAVNDSQLINKGEVKTLIANSSAGKWENIYDNGSLKPADDGQGNYYYVFTPNTSNLDKFSQAGKNDNVAVPRLDLHFTTDLTKPFYDFSIVGDFSSEFGAGTGGIWLEDTLTLTANEVDKEQYKDFVVEVKAKEPITDVIYNKEVLRLTIPFIMTFDNSYAEVQIGEQIDYIKYEYVSSTDTKPKITQGTWLTSDKDFRINKTDMLSVGSQPQREPLVVERLDITPNLQTGQKETLTANIVDVNDIYAVGVTVNQSNEELLLPNEILELSGAYFKGLRMTGPAGQAPTLTTFALRVKKGANNTIEFTSETNVTSPDTWNQVVLIGYAKQGAKMDKVANKPIDNEPNKLRKEGK